MAIFYLAFILIGLCGMFLFHGNMLLCGIMMAFSAAGAGLRLFAGGKSSLGKWKKAAAAGIPVCMALCLFVGQSGAEGGMGDYKEKIRQAASLIDKGDLDGGMLLLKELEEEFGGTDLALYAGVEIRLALGEYDRALNEINAAQDQTRQDWYEYMERILSLQGTDAAMERLEELYLSGAEDLPDNGHMQYMAGLVKLGRGAYQSAAYYFSQARRLERGDGRPCYYLGLICHEQNDDEKAAEYFSEALDRGVDGDMAANIQWYTR